MGAAAYNRGSLAISKELDAELPSAFSQSIRSLDETPRDDDAVAPFDTGLGLTLAQGNGGWWLTCNKTGFGYWAKSARALLRRHLVYISEVTQSPLSIQCRPWPTSSWQPPRPSSPPGQPSSHPPHCRRESDAGAAPLTTDHATTEGPTMTMTIAQHRSESARYRRLYDDTGITAYSVASAHHAGMAGEPLQLPGAMAIMAIVAIHKTESERREVASLRDGLADTQELPVVETTADLARDDRAGCLPLVPLSRARETAGGAL